VRVLVTGGTGLLGWWIVKVFIEKGFDVVATFHSRGPVGLEDARWVRVNLEDAQSVVGVVKTVRPDVIVHTAAYTDVDGCERDKARAYHVNYLGTRALAEAAGSVELFVYVSTDYVFDGERGLYKEVDIPNPVNYYGLSKLLGEVAVQSILPSKSCIVRVSGLYGYSPTGKRNFGINALVRLLRREEVKAFHDQYLSPTYVVPLAEKLAVIVERRLTGLVHVAGPRMSRYGFALKLAEALGVDRGLIKPISMDELRLAARRPRDSSLDTSWARSLGLDLPGLEECLRDFISTYKLMAENEQA
jgi:dTDP-4-dehydrorhamnose reductase